MLIYKNVRRACAKVGTSVFALEKNLGSQEALSISGIKIFVESIRLKPLLTN